MILVMDIGNAGMDIGIYAGDQLFERWRMATDQQRTEDEYGMQLKALFEHSNLEFGMVEGIIMSSVVPPMGRMLERMCRKYIGRDPLIVGPGVKTGLNIKSDNPREVGTDRIVNAVAAIHEYGGPLIVIDYGTATTYCYIDERNQYHGGLIAPGMRVSAEALYSRTAKLPRIDLVRPDQLIGKNTVAAMQSGVLYGFCGQAEGIVSRMKKESGKSVKVIATGALAPLIASETAVIDYVDAELTLRGLYIIYKRNSV
ncbi:type III pantothenate kinase [Planomicrobium sp. YIM 101495]|uniref:type III pantothenate kinase n=1 Tax=Planomicrobium sp. YIM 101495 TaxID=2665160 RepID=UPI0012B7C1C7|nr:type III pantothenate kinase [Planomicrobium sp. YIM 101495]MTD32178.1 type III pantothenate kinase [Planomicrobium sp. YIM 101495]